MLAKNAKKSNFVSFVFNPTFYILVIFECISSPKMLKIFVLQFVLGWAKNSLV